MINLLRRSLLVHGIRSGAPWGDWLIINGSADVKLRNTFTANTLNPTLQMGIIIRCVHSAVRFEMSDLMATIHKWIVVFSDE